MSERYLLPCPCGRRIPVAARHAGEEVPCECGQKLPVPPLMQLKRLERVADAPRAVTSAWGLRQALVTIGVLVAVGGLALVAYSIHSWPQPPYSGFDAVAFEDIVAKATPLRAWNGWIQLKKNGLVPGRPRDQELYETALVRAQIEVGVAVAVGLLGLGLAGSSLLLAPGKRSAGSRSNKSMLEARARGTSR